MNAISVNNVHKRYKNGVPALKGLSLSVERGEVFALLGPNGAGKSTLINILTTFLKPDSGNVTILNNDLCVNPANIRKHIACVSQNTSIDSFLSLRDNMIFHSKLYGISKAVTNKRMQLLITAFGLERYADLPVSSYSGGVKRRLDIALAMMSDPDILFLDEPTTGMDVQSRKVLWEMTRQIQQDFGTTIFLTTHYLEEADMLSNNICIMQNGSEITQGSPASLRHLLHQDKITLSFPPESEIRSFYPQLRNSYPCFNWQCCNNVITCCYGTGQLDISSITQFLLNSQIQFTGISIAMPSLEDVFLTLTSSDTQEVC